jgi:hypothetical protein
MRLLQNSLERRAEGQEPRLSAGGKSWKNLLADAFTAATRA